MSSATVLIISAVFLVGLASGALIILWVLRNHKMVSAPEKTLDVARSTPIVEKAAPLMAPLKPLVFRPIYVLAPLILAITCLIIALAFVSFLPSPLAFRFNSDGSALTSMNKYVFVILMAAAQLLCALAAWSVAQVIVGLGKKIYKASEPQMDLSGFVALMSNMVLLPQVIMAYLMLDAFIYGVWSGHLISTRNFAFTAVVIGSAILCAMFIRLASRARSALNKQ
jgi:uncharacterized membrane protein